MRLIQGAIDSPVKTAVGVILLLLFGLIALFGIPVQLTPTVEEPQITVQTFWPGASPGEVEREIIDEQEEQLKGLDGLVKMSSSSQDSMGSINLLFEVGRLGRDRVAEMDLPVFIHPTVNMLLPCATKGGQQEGQYRRGHG